MKYWAIRLIRLEKSSSRDKSSGSSTPRRAVVSQNRLFIQAVTGFSTTKTQMAMAQIVLISAIKPEINTFFIRILLCYPGEEGRPDGVSLQPSPPRLRPWQFLYFFPLPHGFKIGSILLHLGAFYSCFSAPNAN